MSFREQHKKILRELLETTNYVWNVELSMKLKKEHPKTLAYLNTVRNNHRLEKCFLFESIYFLLNELTKIPKCEICDTQVGHITNSDLKIGYPKRCGRCKFIKINS